MSWPRDDAKLDRVRELMAQEELDAVVVRAPDNVLYLTNFWGMKGYDAAVFPYGQLGGDIIIAGEHSWEIHQLAESDALRPSQHHCHLGRSKLSTR